MSDLGNNFITLEAYLSIFRSRTEKIYGKGGDVTSELIKKQAFHQPWEDEGRPAQSCGGLSTQK